MITVPEDAYIDVTDADAYHLARGNTAWTGTDAVKEAAIIRAANALDGIYRKRYTGIKATKAQALAWPRTQAYDADGFEFDDDEIPPVLISANAEAALIELVTPGGMTPVYESGVRRKREKVDVLEEETEYRSDFSGRETFSIIDGLMSDILAASRFVTLVERS